MDDAMHEGAWSRAKREAASVYRSPAFGIALALTEVVVVSASYLFVAESGTSTGTAVAVPILSGALAMALALVGVFAIKLAAAPVAQREEARASLSSAPIGSAPNVEATILNYARVAEDNADSMAAIGSYTKTDEAQADEWTNEVAAFLGEHAPEHAAEFINATHGFGAGVTDKMEARFIALRSIAAKL